MKVKKALKIFGKVDGVVVGIILLVCIVLYLNHHIRLHAETPLTEPFSRIAEVDGQKLSVYTEGSGAHTLVFLQGGGYPCPILVAKSLYSKLSGDYRIVVIERPGYGFSPEPDRIIPLAEELELERSALGRLGIAGPYILVPHSASGIESLLWAGKYPDEVETIVGLDMSIPAYYHEVYDLDQMEILRNSNLLFSEIQFAMMKELGLARFYDLNEVLDAFRTGNLSESDKAVYRAVAYKIYFNKSMSCDRDRDPDHHSRALCNGSTWTGGVSFPEK